MHFSHRHAFELYKICYRHVTTNSNKDRSGINCDASSPFSPGPGSGSGSASDPEKESKLYVVAAPAAAVVLVLVKSFQKFVQSFR